MDAQKERKTIENKENTERKMRRQFKHVTELTEQFLKDKYTLDQKDTNLYKYKLEDAFEFLGVTDKEFVESYKKATDKQEWVRETSRKVTAYYNDLIRKGKAINTARAQVTPIRAFSSEYCAMLKVKVDKPQRAHGQHAFSQIDLAKIYSIGDTREKAIIAFGVATAFNAEQLIETKRSEVEPLVNRAISENADFTPYEYTRGKTLEEGFAILAKPTITALKEWLDFNDKDRKEKGLEPSEWLFASNGHHITE